ncbi:MAG: AAA family ATPase [Candidatus Saccharimonadales bacterium]
MSLIYVTGIAGAGKSAVCEELTKRGFEAHEGDDNLSAFYNNETGEITDRPTTVTDRTPEWRAEHTWKMSKEALQKLKASSDHKPVFVCGVASNENEYIDVFDKVFALDVDIETLMHRITTRTTGDFGKSPHEMETLLNWHKSTGEYYRKIGAYIVNTSKPLNEVVDVIVEQVLA